MNLINLIVFNILLYIVRSITLLNTPFNFILTIFITTFTIVTIVLYILKLYNLNFYNKILIYLILTNNF